MLSRTVPIQHNQTMQSKVFAPFAKHISNEFVGIDFHGFVSRILLYDHYTIDSSLMQEIGALTNNLGIEGVSELLKSGIVSIHTDATSIGIFENTDPTTGIKRPTDSAHNIISYNLYDPVVIGPADRTQYVGYGLANIDKLTYPLKKKIKLKNAIVDRLTTLPEKFETPIWTRDSLMTNAELAQNSVVIAVKDILGREIAPTNITFHFEAFGTNGYRAESNLQQTLKITEYEEHKIFERAILLTSGFYDRMRLMKSYDSIAWFGNQDKKLLEAELKKVALNTDSNSQEDRFTRVLELKGMPVFDNNMKVDINQLMRVRESRECKQFREWLSSTDAKSDKDIQSEINSLRNALSTVLGKTSNKTLRFILSTVIGTSNAGAGIALGVIDTFIIDKFFKPNVPVSFINDQLPRLRDLN